MKPIKNTETQKFCELVAETYKTDPVKATELWLDFVRNSTAKMWEILAMQDQIRFLVKGYKRDMRK